MGGVGTGSHPWNAVEVPISVQVDVGLNRWWSMGKTQHHNDVTTQNQTRKAQGSEGHINFSQWVDFKGEQRENLVRKK